MGKQGPCYHCGVTSTPLWRNGPPEKPVLCNACGSRWRTKGTLANYTPLHARAETDDNEDHKFSRMKSISIGKKKDSKVLKRKQNYEYGIIGGDTYDYNYGFRKILDEDMSNKSSSGSAISNSESCAQFVDASDLTGPAQSVVWETMVPSKKRTCAIRAKPSAVEKLTKDLYAILHEQQFSNFSGSSEEDLIFESATPLVSVEIGHGSVLISHPNSIAREEESEASSLSVDNKQYHLNEAYSHSIVAPVNNDDKEMKLLSLTNDYGKEFPGRGMQRELLKRDRSKHEILGHLRHHNSPLCYVDLNDIVNFEEFVRNLSDEEQQKLLTFLPAVDTAEFPESLKSMYESPQFKENLVSFQKLLEEGVFDISLSGIKAEDCRSLKRLALSNLTKSTWVESYCLLKKCKGSTRKLDTAGAPDFTAEDCSSNVKRSCDSQNKKFPETRIKIKSPKIMITKSAHEESIDETRIKIKSPKIMITKSAHETESIDGDGSSFSPRNLFALPSDGLDSVHFTEDSSDHDLLLEVPSSGSFPQAELLHSATRSQQASASSSSVHQ